MVSFLRLCPMHPQPVAWQADDRIQHLMRMNFDIESDFGFRAVGDGDICRILHGMLTMSVEERWTAAEALAAAEDVARQRGIFWVCLGASSRVGFRWRSGQGFWRRPCRSRLWPK